MYVLVLLNMILIATEINFDAFTPRAILTYDSSNDDLMCHDFLRLFYLFCNIYKPQNFIFM